MFGLIQRSGFLGSIASFSFTTGAIVIIYILWGVENQFRVDHIIGWGVRIVSLMIRTASENLETVKYR